MDLTQLTPLELNEDGEKLFFTPPLLEDKSNSKVAEDIELESYNKDDIVDLASTDLDVLAGLALGEAVTLLFPPVFLAIWQLLTTSSLKVRDFTKLAIGLPRGFGKTTVIKLLIFWMILYSTKKYILITAANATKAERILKDVKRLFASPNIRAIFGNVLSDCETDTQELLIFTYNGRLITLQALGSGGDPRGSNIGFNRPDVIISDDVQSKENAESPTQAKALREWYYATLMPAKSEKGCLYIYIGNMFASDGCLLREFRDSIDWTSFIAGAILADGHSIWEEFTSTEEILAQFQAAIRSNTTHIFFSEILNDSTASGNIIFDASKVKQLDKNTFVGLEQGSFIVIDPAGAKATSNDTAIGYVVLIDGVPYLKEIDRGIYTPQQTITRSLNMAKAHSVGVICVEAYAYQASLLSWFTYIAKIHDIYGIEFLPITRGSQSKNSAIVKMVSQLQSGEVGVFNHLMGEVLTDVVRFNPQTKENKDDLLDLLVYAPLIVIKYRENIGRLINLSYQDYQDVSVRSVAENCNF